MEPEIVFKAIFRPWGLGGGGMISLLPPPTSPGPSRPPSALGPPLTILSVLS